MENLINNYFTRLISGIIIGVGIITNFVKRLESTFKNCKTHNISKYTNNEDWSTLTGTKLWTRIDWSGKLSSTRTYDTPEDEKLLKFFEKLYCPGQELLLKISSRRMAFSSQLQIVQLIYEK